MASRHIFVRESGRLADQRDWLSCSISSILYRATDLHDNCRFASHDGWEFFVCKANSNWAFIIANLYEPQIVREEPPKSKLFHSLVMLIYKNKSIYPSRAPHYCLFPIDILHSRNYLENVSALPGKVSNENRGIYHYPQYREIGRNIYSSSSSSPSLTTLKNLSSYTPLEVETTRSQSLRWCFFKNFLVL